MKTRLNLIAAGGMLILMGAGASLIGAQVQTWLYFVGGALFIWALFPDFHLNRYNKIFKRCDLFIRKDNGSIEIPKVRKEYPTINGYECEIIMPIGLCSDDLRQKSQKITEALKASHVEFEYKKEFVLMLVIE